MGMTELAVLLEGVRGGDLCARDALMVAAYQELRTLARAAALDDTHSPLQPTKLVDVAWGRLFGEGARQEHRRHYLGAAAQAMRQVLLDRVRLRGALQRDWTRERVSIHDTELDSLSHVDIEVLKLEEVLTELESFQPRLARLLELRYFAGQGLAETAAALGVSIATVRRDWAYVRGWLVERLSH
ncbi:ECF-type sigma factor [Myxococcus sp. K15C18031901]|uniref:ECF-type sigma factor n=1 Tax=Myxococcus dinghuensis TaxID=2906761 RepID=UPI0020A78E0C|nr:ECF-type sigma factor [Myxococcus dinghuensis]MCP3102146.1 ECF-type sigma factor [Myxococcus dinghuensis]